MMPPRLADDFENRGTVDYSYSLSDLGRFRVSAYHQKGMVSIALRTINQATKTFEDLFLPPVLGEMINVNKGLVLVTGITGSGKSTTLAAMLNLVNRNERIHIITIEDPIEFIYTDDKALIDQIEVGTDVDNFKVALRGALRQDPDIILVGEMRDRETVETAIHCVETGHVVFSTLHTPDAKQTILRMLHFFPAEDHRLINQQMAMNLRGVVCQKLLKSVDGKQRFPCCEILINTPIITKLIREERYDDIDKVLVSGDSGMQSFDTHLVQLVKSEMIALDEALTVVNDEAAFKRSLAGRSAGGDRRAIIT
jgi:twitching motility protein PilT